MSDHAMPAAPKLAWRRTPLGAAARRLRAMNGAVRPAAPSVLRNVRREAVGKSMEGWVGNFVVTASALGNPRAPISLRLFSERESFRVLRVFRGETSPERKWVSRRDRRKRRTGREIVLRSLRLLREITSGK